jgi:hypothetical protein
MEVIESNDEGESKALRRYAADCAHLQLLYLDHHSLSLFVLYCLGFHLGIDPIPNILAQSVVMPSHLDLLVKVSARSYFM